MLTHWTKKIILEEGHSMQQLYHILQLLVRHYKVYYPVRHHLIQQMITSMHRLGFSPNATIDYRKLAVELAEVIIKWELQRIKDETDGTSFDEETTNLLQTEKIGGNNTGIKRSIQEEDARKKMNTGDNACEPPVPQPPKTEESTRPIEKNHCDTVVNFLFRLSCQLNDMTPPQPGVISPGENLSRRCVTLLKLALKPDVWASTQCDLKLTWLDKVFVTIESTQTSIGNICTGLELLTFLLGVIKKDQVLSIFRPLQRGLSICVTSTNTKVIKLMHGLLTRLMAIFPTDTHNKVSRDFHHDKRNQVIFLVFIIFSQVFCCLSIRL